MIVPDTSDWVQHLRTRNRLPGRLILDRQIDVHPMIIGEIARGALSPRAEFVRRLNQLPSTGQRPHADVLAFVEEHRLYGIGLGWVDAHILATIRAIGARLWTMDRRLRLSSIPCQTDEKSGLMIA